jgi:methionine synthase I (cobalamin-dependent)
MLCIPQIAYSCRRQGVAYRRNLPKIPFSSERVGRRFLEFKANASPLSTQEIVRLDHLEGDDPERFAAEMWEIHEDFGLPVLGGCCGTDDRHMRTLAARMAPTGSTS